MKVKTLIELQQPQLALNISNSMYREGSSGDVELLFLRARCLYLINKMEDALKHLQEAMRMDPDNSEVRLFLKKLKNMENKKEEGNQAFLAGDLSRACESSS